MQQVCAGTLENSEQTVRERVTTPAGRMRRVQSGTQVNNDQTFKLR